jgi:hypothetical protein
VLKTIITAINPNTTDFVLSLDRNDKSPGRMLLIGERTLMRLGEVRRANSKGTDYCIDYRPYEHHLSIHLGY